MAFWAGMPQPTHNFPPPAFLPQGPFATVPSQFSYGPTGPIPTPQTCSICPSALLQRVQSLEEELSTEQHDKATAQKTCESLSQQLCQITAASLAQQVRHDKLTDELCRAYRIVESLRGKLRQRRIHRFSSAVLGERTNKAVTPTNNGQEPPDLLEFESHPNRQQHGFSTMLPANGSLKPSSTTGNETRLPFVPPHQTLQVRPHTSASEGTSWMHKHSNTSLSHHSRGRPHYNGPLLPKDRSTESAVHAPSIGIRDHGQAPVKCTVLPPIIDGPMQMFGCDNDTEVATDLPSIRNCTMIPAGPNNVGEAQAQIERADETNLPLILVDEYSLGSPGPIGKVASVQGGPLTKLSSHGTEMERTRALLMYHPGSRDKDVYRTVIATNLRSGATLSDVLGPIHEGIVVSAKMMHTLPMSGSNSAMILFLHESAARCFVAKMSKGRSSCVGSKEHAAAAEATTTATAADATHDTTETSDMAYTLLRSPTYPLTAEEHWLIFQKKVTRCISMQLNNSRSAMQFVRDALVDPLTTEDALVRSEQDGESILRFEFESVLAAGRALERVTRHRWFRGVVIRNLPDPCDGQVADAGNAVRDDQLTATIPDKTDGTSADDGIEKDFAGTPAPDNTLDLLI